MDNEEKIELLGGLCGAIFGSHWKQSLAEHLGINDRSIRQWANGERTIPDSIIRGLLSLAHDRANLIIRRAESAAIELSDYDDNYERVLYVQGMTAPNLRPDLYTAKREWYDIDGRLYALNENGVIIDINGNETSLPAGVTVSDLQAAAQKYITENGYSD